MANTTDIISQVLSVVGWPTIVLIAWKVSDTLGTMKAQISLIMSNHLPHIYEELKQLRKEKS